MLKPKLSQDSPSFLAQQKRSLETTIDVLTEILASAYICHQFGFNNRLSGEKERIYKTSGKKLAQALCLPYSVSYNRRDFIWARENRKQYDWVLKVWWFCLIKYLGKNNKDYPCLAYYKLFNSVGTNYSTLSGNND